MCRHAGCDVDCKCSYGSERTISERRVSWVLIQTHRSQKTGTDYEKVSAGKIDSGGGMILCLWHWYSLFLYWWRKSDRKETNKSKTFEKQIKE